MRNILSDCATNTRAQIGIKARKEKTLEKEAR